MPAHRRRLLLPEENILKEQLFRMSSSVENEKMDLRITAFSSQGERDHMEDHLALLPSNDNNSTPPWVCAAVFDGHGGGEASKYARKHLLKAIIQNPKFCSNDDDDIMEAIREGYLQIQQDMLRHRDSWPKTSSGYPSTAGTTASVAIIRNGKLYIGHVGDSRIVLGRENSLRSSTWTAMNLTVDHKPENKKEKARIEANGGQVVTKGNVSRVVWTRTVKLYPCHEGNSIITHHQPFLNVARSLGDFWSYKPDRNTYLISPEPDVSVITLNPSIHRCLILASDGLWGVVSSKDAVAWVQETLTSDDGVLTNARGVRDISTYKNPSVQLGRLALHEWMMRNSRADNIAILTIAISPSTVVSTSPETPNLMEEGDLSPSHMDIPKPSASGAGLRPRKNKQSEMTSSVSRTRMGKSKPIVSSPKSARQLRSSTSTAANSALSVPSKYFLRKSAPASMASGKVVASNQRGKASHLQFSVPSTNGKRGRKFPASCESTEDHDQPDFGVPAKMIKIATNESVKTLRSRTVTRTTSQEEQNESIIREVVSPTSQRKRKSQISIRASRSTTNEGIISSTLSPDVGVPMPSSSHHTGLSKHAVALQKNKQKLSDRESKKRTAIKRTEFISLRRTTRSMSQQT